MRIDKGQISSRLLLFSVACLPPILGASNRLPNGNNKARLLDCSIAWGNSLSALLWLLGTLMAMFPEQNLIQILDEVYGPVLGKILGLAYLWFFLTLSSVNLTDLADFTKGTIMFRTPAPAMSAVCILVSAIAVRKGIKLVTKFSPLFVIVAIVTMTLSTFLVINQFKLENFLPIFTLPAKSYFQGTHIISTIPFGEMVVYLMIHPNVKFSRREIRKSLFWGFAVGGLTLWSTTLRDIGVLGNTVDLFTVPSLITFRLVQVGPSISRTEILFAIILIMLLFYKITLLYYVAVLTISQLFKIRSYNHLVLVVGS